jgi:photosystem II stability/assembly factor-like uncharacterized protein
MSAMRWGKRFSVAVVSILVSTTGLVAQINEWSKIGPDGADVLKLIMDPRSPQTLYAITNCAGLFKTEDGAAHWKQIGGDVPSSVFLPPYAVRQSLRFDDLAISPFDSSLLYAVIASKFYRSLDGGEHWDLRSSPVAIRAIAPSPLDGQTVFAGSSSGVLKSADGGLTWNPPASSVPLSQVGIIKFDPQNPSVLYAVGDRIAKSMDGGETWFDLSPGFSGYLGFASDFAVDPRDSSRLYILCTSGLYASADGGVTWTGISAVFAESIAVDPADSSILYLGYLSADPANFYWNTARSADGGQTWSLFLLDRFRLLFDPDDPSIVYAAAWKKGVYKSEDGGLTWAFRSTGIRKATPGALAFGPTEDLPGPSPRNGAPIGFATSTIYVGSPAGVFTSSDGGETWQGTNDDLSNKSFSDLRVEDAAGTALRAGIANVAGGIGGFAPGGIFASTDGGAHWTGLNEGLTSRDVRRVFSAPFSALPGGAVAAPAASNTFYAATNGGGVFKSVDGGASWSPKNSGLSYLYLTDLVIDPANPRALFASNYWGVLKSSDAAESWTGPVLSQTTNCLAADPNQPGVFYAGTVIGVYKSSDGGESWTKASAGMPGEIGFGITCLAVDPRDPGRVLAGTGGAGVFLSLDGADLWTPVLDGINNLQIKCVGFDPVVPNKIFASTDGDGLYSMTFDPAPQIVLDKTHLRFGAGPDGSVTTSQKVRVSNPGVVALRWTATASASWIRVTPSSGTGGMVLDVSVDPAALAAGAYAGAVQIEDPAASNSPQAVFVDLTVYPESVPTGPPFGNFDTPIEGRTGVGGAIPVTGWALDDIEVVRIEIKRDPHPGDPPLAIGADGLVYVGDGIFVEGARPDVELVYPAYPLSSRAGWGYMLLTNTLPGGGNGAYRFYALAADVEGYTTLLGTKTIFCDNANATRPFGTIDTPGQGETIWGSSYVNFGWVLTPLPKGIPKDGSTIRVYVDSILKGALSAEPNFYDQYRVDVSTAFPGLYNTGAPGAGGPVGAFFLNTTRLAEGIHTIGWTAYDDAGVGEGIGSRFFSVANSGGSSVAAAGSAPAAGKAKAKSPGPGDIPLSDAAVLPIRIQPISLTTGFDPKAPSMLLAPDHAGICRVVIPETNRLEIELEGPPGDREEFAPSARWAGYVVVGDELRPLPIGSTLDRRTGRFSWMPGPGFLGTYDLMFLRIESSGLTRKLLVRITVDPKAGASSGSAVSFTACRRGLS